MHGSHGLPFVNLEIKTTSPGPTLETENLQQLHIVLNRDGKGQQSIHTSRTNKSLVASNENYKPLSSNLITMKNLKMSTNVRSKKTGAFLPTLQKKMSI